MPIPLATLSEADVVGLTGSRNKTDASFVVILVHSKGDDLALSGSYLNSIEKASGTLKIKINFLSSAREIITNVLKFAAMT